MKTTTQLDHVGRCETAFGTDWLNRWKYTKTRRDEIRAKMGQLEKFQGILPKSQGHNMALTVLCVPDSLDSGFFTPLGLANAS